MFSPTPWFGVDGLRGRGGAQDASKKYARAAGALQGPDQLEGPSRPGLGGGQLGHPAQIHTHHLLRHSALGLPRRLSARVLRLCVGVTRLHRVLPGAHHKAPQAPRGGCAGASGHRHHRLPRAATLGHREPADGTAKTRPFMQRLGFVDATYCLYGTPFKKQTRFWTNMRWAPSCGLCGPGNRCKVWENGRHARAAQRGPRKKSASATRTFAGSP